MPFALAFPLAEGEQVSQVSDRGSVERDIGVREGRDRIRKIISAPRGHRRQAPVVFDELENRDVVGISVRDVPMLGPRRDHHQRDPREWAKTCARARVDQKATTGLD
jgi:hypothetical protein